MIARFLIAQERGCMKITCPKCLSSGNYEAYEYVGEFFLCRYCKKMVMLVQVFDLLTREDQKRLLANQITREALRNQFEEEILA